MTWKEFKDGVEAQGVKDDDPVHNIDYSSADTFSGVECHKETETGSWSISNESY
jgi:hypothetical protein